MATQQLSLTLDYGISREQACILCHLASGCGSCCARCDHKNGCHGQTCSQPTRNNEGQRWDSWMHLVENFPHIKEYAVKVISPELRKKYGINKLINKKN